MKKTIIMVLIAAAIGAYLYFYEIKGGEKRQKEKEASEKLVHFEMDSVQTVILNSSQGKFIFEKDMDEWRMEEPVNTLADKSNVTSLINNLKNAKKERTFNIRKNELDKFGLSPAKAVRVELKTKSGKSLLVKFGDNTNIGSNAYVTIDDSLVATIPAYIKNSAKHDLFYWRDKKVIRFEKRKVKEFTLINPYGKYVFKNESGNWTLDYPLKTKAEQSKVNAILNKFDYQNIKSVVADNPKGLGKYGLNNPAYKLELLSGEEKAKIEVVFSKPKDGIVYGKSSGKNYIFTLDTLALSPMNKKLYDYRDKRILEYDDSHIDRVNLFYNDKLNKLYKDTTNAWYGNENQKVKGDKVGKILATIKNLKAAEFVEENAHYFRQYGLLNPRGKVEIFSGDKKLAELDVGIKNGNKVFVRNPLDKKVVKVNESEIEKIFPLSDDLYEKKEDKKSEKADK